MRWTLAMAVLLACQRQDAEPHDGNGDAKPTTATPDPLDWGVVRGCDAPRADGFDEFYDGSPALLVHGDAPEDEALAREILGWYGDTLDLELRRGSELTDADRGQNLFIVGHPATNPILSELDGALPMRFDDEGFVFGGYRYGEPGNGIAFVHPSPFAEGRWLLLHVGNTFAGAYSTFTVWSGASDYVTTRGRSVVQQEGAFCTDEVPWGWIPRWSDDVREPWDAWVAGLERAEGPHHVFHFGAGGDFDAERDWILDWQDDEHARALELLDVEALDHPIQIYAYANNAQKGELTGSAGNAHANDLNHETHWVYGDGVYAAGAHEDVHVIAWHRIGATHHTLMGEGLAVYANGEWWGEDLGYWASTHRADGTLPALDVLIDDFWSVSDGITYPVAGHFVQFLADGWGIDVVKRLYVAEDLRAAFEIELGLTSGEVEAAWHATIE